jgi:hypothetical protein
MPAQGMLEKTVNMNVNATSHRTTLWRPVSGGRHGRQGHRRAPHVTDTQEDVRIEFINTRLGPTLAAQLPIELRTCLLGLPRPCSRPNFTDQARMVERPATSSTP